MAPGVSRWVDWQCPSSTNDVRVTNTLVDFYLITSWVGEVEEEEEDAKC